MLANLDSVIVIDSITRFLVAYIKDVGSNISAAKYLGGGLEIIRVSS